MKKITIVNQPLCNRGDQAAHKALINLFKEYCDCEIEELFIGSAHKVKPFAKNMNGVRYTVFDYPLGSKKSIFRYSMYLPRIFLMLMKIIPEVHKYNKIIKKSDYVLCAPGGICMGGYKNWRHIWNLANAIHLKKRTGIYGRSIGPFYDKDGHLRALYLH